MKTDYYRQKAAGFGLLVFILGFMVLPLLHRHFDNECHADYFYGTYSSCDSGSVDDTCHSKSISDEYTENGECSEDLPSGSNHEHCSICFLSLCAIKTVLPCSAPLVNVVSFSKLVTPVCNHDQKLEKALHGSRAPPAYSCLSA